MNLSNVAPIISEITQPGGLFPVVEKNIDGSIYKVFNSGPQCLGDVLSHSMGHGEKDFLVYKEERYSFTKTRMLALKAAHQLMAQFNINKGDRVGIAMKNMPEWVISFMAITSLGAIAVPLNSW